jgi:glycosyltransferase involved in cell wall biosynthesis
MKVVMLRSNPIDPDVRIEKEAKTLVDAGHDVTLLGWQRFGDAPAQEKRYLYTIERLKFRAPVGKKVILYLPIWWILAFLWLLREDWDIVHAADLDTYVPALLAAKLKRRRLIYDIFDFYVDMVTLPSFVRSFVAALDTSLMRFADAIIVVDPSRLKQIGKEGDSSIHIIYNSPRDPTTSVIVGIPREPTLFKIFYAGGLGVDRDFETVLQAAKEIGGVRVELAGYGCYAGHLRSISEQEPHVTFIGTIPYDEVIRKTLESDLLFALYDPDVPNNRYASPNKLFEAMMSGKPILVSDETAMAEIVREEDCGLVVPYGDIGAIKHAICTLKNDPALCKHLGENGRKAYETKYSWRIMEERLLEVYEKLDPEQRRAGAIAHSSPNTARHRL